MSTHSRIGYVDSRGMIRSAYCHFDGYPTSQGPLLLQHYNTLGAVAKLVAPGDFSSLAPRCDKPEGHTYNTPVTGHVVYYGRDRGEHNTGLRSAHFRAEYLLQAKDCGASFLYLFQDGQWLVCSRHRNDAFTPLADPMKDLPS